MPKFELVIRREFRRDGRIEVEAESAEEAFAKVEIILCHEDIIDWDAEDFYDDWISVDSIPPNSGGPLLVDWGRDLPELIKIEEEKLALTLTLGAGSGK